MRDGVEKPAPKVSVLIPVYKSQETHLRQAIESVLAQTFRDYELVILNDSPDDKRLEDIAASYQDPRIRFIYNECNMGISGARNKLIELARAPYLAIMDHDDIMLPERLAQQVEYLDSHPDVGVVGCQTLHIPMERPTHYPIDDEDIKLALMHSCIVPHTGSTIRKSILQENNIRYEANYSPSEDYSLWLRLIGCTRFHNLPDILMHYRVYPANTSHRQKKRMTQQTIELHALAHQLYPDLYTRSMEQSKHTTYTKLFGVLPLLKIVRWGNITTTYLFGVLPVLVVKKKVTPCVSLKQ